MICFLIDDDLDDQEFFKLALENIDTNITCQMADDGIQAIQILKDNTTVTPNLIFIDMRMPRMNGSECVREIKKIERMRNIPIILYSTSDEAIGNEEAKKSGASHFFTKPTSIPDLSNILKETIERFSEKRN